MDIKPGDVVYLKTSESPKMTVEWVNPAKIGCVWFTWNDSEKEWKGPCRDTFSRETLKQ